MFLMIFFEQIYFIHPDLTHILRKALSCDWQVDDRVAVHQLVVEGLRLRRAAGRFGFWRRGHRGHGGLRPAVGNRPGRPAALSNGVEEHDWLRGRQTYSGMRPNGGRSTSRHHWGAALCCYSLDVSFPFRIFSCSCRIFLIHLNIPDLISSGMLSNYKIHKLACFFVLFFSWHGRAWKRGHCHFDATGQNGLTFCTETALLRSPHADADRWVLIVYLQIWVSWKKGGKKKTKHGLKGFSYRIKYLFHCSQQSVSKKNL